METNTKKRSRAGTFVKLAVASLAVLGIGGAITAAAWQDHVYFGAAATAGTFNLQGSVTGAPHSWQEGNADYAKIQLPASFLENLRPNDIRTTTVFVRNVGTVGADLTVSTQEHGRSSTSTLRLVGRR